jgi:hypothetical protein
VIICGGCSAELPDRSKFCLQCGTRVHASAQGVAQERKIVTSLFCDLVAFTAMSEAADPEDVDAMLGRYFAMARSAIEAFGGVVEKFIGDAVVELRQRSGQVLDDLLRPRLAGTAALAFGVERRRTSRGVDAGRPRWRGHSRPTDRSVDAGVPATGGTAPCLHPGSRTGRPRQRRGSMSSRFRY